MKVKGTDIYMTRGDSESIGVKLSGYTLTTGDKVELTVRRSVGSGVLLHKEVTEFADNTAVIPITPEDTQKLAFGKYVYDIQLTYGGSVKTIVTPSAFEIGEEVTYGGY